MQVGTTKDQGLYNKPSAAVHPGALAAGTLPQYNTIRCGGQMLSRFTTHCVSRILAAVHQTVFLNRRDVIFDTLLI